MPSPFPGMNPYIEQDDTWEDFHTNFIVEAQRVLARQVGPNYLVKVERRLVLHALPAEERRFIGERDMGIGKGVEVERQAALEIRDRRNRRVVTVIELLSPSNKQPGEDRDGYLAKRRQVLAGQTNLVEIDLRRGGSRPGTPELPPCDYYALISCSADRHHVGFWPIGLRDPLPVIPVPLDAPDPHARLDLKAILDAAYDSADYGKYVYEETPEPPLAPADETWARAFIPVAGR